MELVKRIAPKVSSAKIQWKDWFSHLLWNLHSPTEEFIAQQPISETQTLWYESADGLLSSILYFPKQSSVQKSPVIILTGPLFQPQCTCTKDTPSIQELRDNGHDVYVLSHRGHQQSQSKRQLDYSFDGIVREDISAAVRAIRTHSKYRSYHWIGQGLGGILCIIWIAQSGWSALESLSLINTPTQFEPLRRSSRLSPLSSLLRPLSNSSIQAIFQIKLACAKHWKLSSQERFWLYQSNTQLKVALLQQLLIWLKEGELCNVDGTVSYLNAMGKTDTPIRVYSTGSEFYGGHISSYPIISLFPHAQWIENNSSIHFPLFSESLLEPLDPFE